MPRVGFEPTIPVFERAKADHALDRAAAVIGILSPTAPYSFFLFVFSFFPNLFLYLALETQMGGYRQQNLLLRSETLWRWYFSTNVMFLDIIHRPVYISKHNVSETGFCLRLQVKSEIRTNSVNWAQLSRFYLKMETEFSLRNAV
jgi:hypothetical protein